MLFSAASAVSAKSKNLVPNAGFETGQNAPDNWTRPDDLTVFWEKSGSAAGRCLRLDTDVYRNEWEAHRKTPDVPMKKTPTSGTRYDTVGGTAGVAVYSHPIPVEEDAWYQVEYDCKGPGGEPFVYLKGYWQCTAEDMEHLGEKVFFKPDPDGASYSLVPMGTSGEERRQPKPGDYIQSFRRRFVARFPSGHAGEWCRFTGVVHLKRRHHVAMVLLELYAFWPPGDYWFDNVTMRRISPAAAERYQERRKARGKAANFGTPLAK